MRCRAHDSELCAPFRFSLRSGHLRGDAESGKATSGGLLEYSVGVRRRRESVSYPERIRRFRVQLSRAAALARRRSRNGVRKGNAPGAETRGDTLVSVQWRKAPNHELEG